MTREYALVGCGKTKLSGELPARDKYASDYFKQKRRYAEQNCERWWILSAKYGALPPTQVIDDYDVTIDDADLDMYHRRVYIALHSDSAKWYGDAKLLVFAGRKYIDPIRNILDELRCPVEYPFDGTAGIGEQRARLKEMNAKGRQATLIQGEEVRE